MTIQSASATPCPVWCDRSPETHPDPEGVTMHEHSIGNLGVRVFQCADSQTVIMPPLYQDVVSVADARQAIEDLTAALVVIERASTPRPPR